MVTPRAVPSTEKSNADLPAEYPDKAPISDDEKRQYAQYSRAMWDEQDLAMRGLFNVWTQNLLFLSNKQWWRPDRTGVYVPEIVAEWREQPVVNLALSFFRTFLAKATKTRPAWQVVPGSIEPSDVHATELAQDVLEAKWVELRLSRVLRRAVAWTIVTGNAFILPYWNTNTGKIRRLEVEMEVPVYEEIDGEEELVGTETMMVPLDEDGEPKLGENGRPIPNAEPHVVDEGDVGIKVYSGFQVRVNPEAETDEDVQWFIVADVKSIRELEALHPDLKGKFQAEDVGALESYESALSGWMGANPRNNLTTPADTRDQELAKCLVLHYHERPSVDYPDGRHWVATKDTLIEEPGPLPEGVWPALIHLTDVEVPGRYFASSVLESVVPLNREYNEINAQIKEHHNLMQKGKWLVPKGSGIRRGMITNQPGEVIEYNMGFRPEQAELKNLPTAIYQERDRVLHDFEMVGGIHKVSMGKPPPGVTAGVAFLQLQEADDTDLGPFLAMLEEAVADMAGAILQIIKERYHDERLIHVVGANNRYQVRAFRGADLTGAIDVVPVAESAFPWSKTARQSMLLSLATTMPQLFIDPETGQFDSGKFARLLPMGGLESIAHTEDLDVQEALREEEAFATLGVTTEEIPQVEWWQNHAIHFNQHVRVLKSAEFRDWPVEAQDAFKAHVQQTMEMRDQKAAQAAQMNAMQQGNAPAEVYGQMGGAMSGGMHPPPGDVPPDEAMAEMAEGEMDPELMAQLQALPPHPAQRPGTTPVAGVDEGNILL